MYYMSKFNLRTKAQVLRSRGYPIGKIAKVLGVSKSSASLWCKEIKLSDKIKNKNYFAEPSVLIVAPYNAFFWLE